MNEQNEFEKEIEEDENLAEMIADDLEDEEDEEESYDIMEDPASGASGIKEGY